uniref:steroid 17-alpha-hydroxylase/17,20 lyase n=1 Tax=Myxine glutinosa TaxID=7769 RepID=UPI00358E8965
MSVPALCAILALLLQWVPGLPERIVSAPPPHRLPLLTNLRFLCSKEPMHLLLQHLARAHGDLFSLRLGCRSLLVVSNSTLTREVLLRQGRTFGGRQRMVTTDIISRGGQNIAFGDYGTCWRVHRKIVHAALHESAHGSRDMERIVSREAGQLCTSLAKVAESGEPIELSEMLGRAVTNVVCTLVFSATYGEHDPELADVLAYNRGIVRSVARHAAVDAFPLLRLFPLSGLRELRCCVATRDALLNRKLQQHEESLDPENPRDLMDWLLISQIKQDQGKGSIPNTYLSNDRLLMTTADIFGAGVETTATTLSWLFAFLLHHPEVQQRIQVELDEKVGSERDPRWEDHSRLPQLESAICEVLRIRPVAPLLVPHVAMRDTIVGGCSIPCGTQVIVNMWAVHHDERQWENPEVFDPGRFLDVDGELLVKKPQSYFPFGAGPRICLGEVLARQELFIFSAWLLHRFHLIPVPDRPLPSLEGEVGVVLRPSAYSLLLRLRNS